MEKIWELLKEYAVSYGVRIIIALIILIVGLKLTKAISHRMYKRSLSKNIDPSASGFLRSFLSIALKILVFVITIGVLGVPMTSVITILGTASLAVGLALQGSLANFAGGFMILIFKPFKVGDYIDNHTDSGTVKEIGVFYTTIVTPDNKQITIPNGSLANTSVVNYSVMDIRRVDFEFSISYSSDLEKAKDILLTLAQNNPLVLDNPAPFAAVSAHGDSAIKLAYRVWCKPDDYWTIYFSVLEDVKKLYDEAGIEIPFNCLNIYNRDNG